MNNTIKNVMLIEDDVAMSELIVEIDLFIKNVAVKNIAANNPINNK